MMVLKIYKVDQDYIFYNLTLNKFKKDSQIMTAFD